MNLSLTEIRIVIDCLHERLDSYIVSVNAGTSEDSVNKAKACIDLIYKFRILEQKKEDGAYNESQC